MPVLVKICGLSTPEALDAALDAGADMVGFVFFPPSPRNISFQTARELSSRVKGRAQKVANTVDMSVFIGPTIVHVTQDIASVAVASGGQTPTGSLSSESATSGKAGNAGLDITYRLTRRLGVGVFARYAGGEADLPSAPKLKVGGVQAGAGLRVRF